MRSSGTMLRTSVQADRHGPSITTRSPEARTCSNRWRKSPTFPPGLERTRTSARANSDAMAHSATARKRVRMIRVMLNLVSPVSARSAQRRQSDAGGIKTTVDRQDLPGDVARSVGTQEQDGLRQCLLKAVTVERDGVVIIGTDFRRMYGLGHRGIDRTGRDAVDADAEGGELHGELLGEMGEPGLAGTIGGAQRGGAHRGDRGDVDDRATAIVAHRGGSG